MDSATASQLRGERSSDFLAKMAARRAALERELRGIFSRPTEFIWELGCGHGHFLTAYAQRHPDRICVGIDIVGERIQRALRKRDRAKLNNLFFVHAEARLFLDTLPTGITFSELFILFPDPWPKLRHRKHRILQSDFLSAAAQRSTRDGRLYFRTDFDPYFEEARNAVRAHPFWTLADAPWPFEFDTVFQSRASKYQSLIARRSPALPGPSS